MATFAKIQPTPTSKVAPAKMHSGKMAQDCCMMKDGKMIMKNYQCMMMNGTIPSVSHPMNSGKRKSKTKMGSMKM